MAQINNNEREEILRILLKDNSLQTLENEEIMHLLLEEKVSQDTDSMSESKETFGDRMADHIAQFAGSWTFILLFIFFLVIWIIANAYLLSKPFDAYPFILLNLFLSCVAAIQAPVIMMSQNRQEEKDRMRSLNDYKTNLKTEIIIEDLHQKLDQLIANQERIEKKVNRYEKAKTDSSHTTHH